MVKNKINKIYTIINNRLMKKIKYGHGVKQESCGKKVRTAGKFVPQDHQRLTADYFVNSKFRGLHLFWKLGSGKTSGAISIADKMLDAKKVDHVFVLSPGSLRKNFIDEYCDKAGKSKDILGKKFTFITYNTNVGKYLPNFDGSLVIIDEVHNLINAICNASKNGRAIYEKIMTSKCRLLTLSGTPIYNRPVELAVLTNMLKPGTLPDVIDKDGVIDENFTDLFHVNIDGVWKPVYPEQTLEAFSGVYSYVDNLGAEFYPRIHNMPITKVLMTPEQQTAYLAAYDSESKLAAMNIEAFKYSAPGRYAMMKALKMMAVKNVLSRRPSNFIYPEDIVNLKQNALPTREKRDPLPPKPKGWRYGDPVPDGWMVNEETKRLKRIIVDFEEKKKKPKKKKNAEEESAVQDKLVADGGWIDHKKYFSNGELVKMYSPKFYELLINISNHLDEKHMIFSFFKTSSGVNMLAALLKACGVNCLLYTGDIGTDKQREKMLTEFNAKDNMRGAKQQVILITDAGAEGISLLDTTNVHILESDRRENKIHQVIGRAARYKSLERFPLAKRFVRVWRYWSILPEYDREQKFEYKNFEGELKSFVLKPGMKSIDELLYEKGSKKMKQISSIQQILIDASITNHRVFDTKITKEMLAFAKKNRRVEKGEIDMLVPDHPEDYKDD